MCPLAPLSLFYLPVVRPADDVENPAIYFVFYFTLCNYLFCASFFQTILYFDMLWSGSLGADRLASEI